jgi:hypothetical protein
MLIRRKWADGYEASEEFELALPQGLASTRRPGCLACTPKMPQALGTEIRKDTIDRIIGTSDIELGRRALLGSRPSGRR